MCDCCKMLSVQNPHCLRWGVVNEEYDAHVKLRTNFVQGYDYSRPCKIENLKQSIHNLF